MGGLVVMVAFAIACGGRRAPADSAATAPPAATVPAAPVSSAASPGSPAVDPVQEHVAALRARLGPCEHEPADRWPSRACRRAIRTLVAGCGTADLVALATTDRVTAPCKAALHALLPARDSHRARVLVLGAARTPGALDVWVTASDADGEPALATLDALALAITIDGRVEPVAGASTPLPTHCERPLFTASSILDYSGSMSDDDIDASIAVFQTLAGALPAGCFASDVLVFSTDVRRRGPVTADPATLARALARDPSMPRATTALVDALGDGVTSVRTRAAPIRLLLVATDGKENASRRWTDARVLAAARADGVRIVSFGSLLSDVAFLDRLGRDTGGFFLFRAHARLLADAAHGVARLLAATRRVRITDPRVATATHVVVGDVHLPLR